MESVNGIRNLEKRIEEIEIVLAAAAGGDFGMRLSLTEKDPDMFSSLEQGINVLLSDMGDEVMESRRRASELQDKLDLIEKQQEAIEELSTPIIKIWDKVLVLPLIGSLDTRRSQKLTESLLNSIATTQTRFSILDITGVPAVDSAVANHLLKTVEAVKLLGADCVITGIRPDVAQTIVHLGVDLFKVETLSNLAEGLQWAFERMNLKLVETNNK